MASDSNIDRAIRQLPPPSSSSSSSPSPMTSPPRPSRQGSSSRDVLPSHHRPGQLHVHGRTRSISISSRASGFSQEELVRPTLTFADDRGELTGIPGYLARVRGVNDNMLTTAFIALLAKYLLCAPCVDSLMALPPPTRIAPNRSVWKRITHVHHYPASVTLPLTCLSIGQLRRS
jgi:hypothetical protein